MRAATHSGFRRGRSRRDRSSRAQTQLRITSLRRTRGQRMRSSSKCRRCSPGRRGHASRTRREGREFGIPLVQSGAHAIEGILLDERNAGAATCGVVRHRATSEESIRSRTGLENLEDGRVRPRAADRFRSKRDAPDPDPSPRCDRRHRKRGKPAFRGRRRRAQRVRCA